MKSITVALQSHYDEDATTLCLIARVRCKNGTVLGFTSLDADVTYDPAAYDPHGTGDDWGSAVHRADNGFTPERMQATADMAVDNTDLIGWISDTGITEQQIRSGLFDYAEVRLYRVNYMALGDGHEVMGVGTLGETKFSQNGWRTEFRSLVQQLMQPISKLYSLTCREKFGSMPLGTGGEQPESRTPCGKVWVWVAGTVTSVGAESDRIFSDSALTEADDHFKLGVVEWLTGDNAGEQMEVDSHASDTLTLALPLHYAIAVGDTFRVRQDCDKSFAMCRDVHNNVLNNRSEHLIPIADGGASLIPGAQIQRS